MTKKGKSAAIAELRREVGFGCPVCRSPFLTWHHFDPPWHVEKHWRPDGIIAMCPICHADADAKGGSAGAYSVDELRAMKNSSRSLDDVHAHFPIWQDKRQLLVRVGGVYTDALTPIISINEEPQIALSRSDAGILSLSFQLRDKNDQVLVDVKDNWFIAHPESVHDMQITPKTKSVKVWLDREDVGLEFSFKRVAVSELEELLGRDMERQKVIAARRIKHTKRWADDLPSDLRPIDQSADRTGPFVMSWAAEHCQMDDGLIPLLDFEQMALYYHGERIVIRDGIAKFLGYCALFGNAKGAINIGCQCAECSTGQS